MEEHQEKKKMERKITFRVDQETYDTLSALANSEGFTISVMVRNLVYRFLKNFRQNRLL